MRNLNYLMDSVSQNMIFPHQNFLRIIIKQSLNIQKMEKKSSVYPNVSDQTQFRLKKINEIKDYVIHGIHKREVLSKRSNKYIAAFDYFDKALIVLFAKSDEISIASFATVIGESASIASASFSFTFSITI